ncbi:MAG: hypothetical protein O2907_01450, partial [Proteobacteria bacterium]|nr:hypothetical protein [Pseudomonadota bacterium]
KEIGIRSFAQWSPAERNAFERITPLVAITHPENWSAADKRSLRELSRAKGGACEAGFARRLGQHRPLLLALRRCCRQRAGAASS